MVLLQPALTRRQRAFTPLLETSAALLLSRAITQFYREPFISKELEVRLHQIINYPVHNHSRDKTQLLPSSCWHHGWAQQQTWPGVSLQKQSQICPFDMAFSSKDCTDLHLMFLPDSSDLLQRANSESSLHTRFQNKPQNHKLGVNADHIFTLDAQSCQSIAFGPHLCLLALWIKFYWNSAIRKQLWLLSWEQSK